MINKLRLIALLLTIAPTICATNYTELFTTMGKKRGSLSKKALQNKGTFTYPFELSKTPEDDLSILSLLALDDCPKELTNQSFSLQQAYFKGMKSTFTFNAKPTGKDAHIRAFIIHIYNTLISAGISATGRESFFAKLETCAPDLERLAKKSLSEKEQRLIGEMHNGDITSFYDIGTLADTPFFKRGLDIGQKINDNLLKELNGDLISSDEKEALIAEIFDVIVSQTASNSKEYCAGLYLSRAHLGTLNYSPTNKNNDLNDSYRQLRYEIADVLTNLIGSFIFEYEGYYREVEITQEGNCTTSSIAEGFRDSKPLTIRHN